MLNQSQAEAMLEWRGASLRFELSTGGSYVEMFVQAFDRGRSILRTTFAHSERLVYVFELFRSAPLVHQMSAMRSIRQCGIELRRPFLKWEQSPSEEWEEGRSFLVFESGREFLDRVLWGAIAHDLGVRPRLLCRVCVYDPDAGIAAHPYDDRGMDVFGPNTDRLRTLHAELGALLLDYDRERMAQELGIT